MVSQYFLRHGVRKITIQNVQVYSVTFFMLTLYYLEVYLFQPPETTMITSKLTILVVNICLSELVLSMIKKQNIPTIMRYVPLQIMVEYI